MASDGYDNSSFAVEQALSNPRILTQIFKNLDTPLLLSSRLVSKTWAKEAATFIQNNRQCYVSQPADENACGFLRLLDVSVGNMAKKQSGGTIPFNGLKIKFCNKDSMCSVGMEDELTDYVSLFENLDRHVNLKYLDISCGEDEEDENYCSAHNPLVTLLCDKSEELKRLKISGSFELLEKNWMEHWTPLRFTQLELLDISEVSVRYRFETDEKIVVDQLFNNAPRLKRIIAKRMCQVALIPKEKMSLLLRLQEKPDLVRMKKEFQSRFVKASE